MQNAAAEYSCKPASANERSFAAHFRHMKFHLVESWVWQMTLTQYTQTHARGREKKTLLDDFIVRVYCQFTTAAKTIDKVCVGRHQHEYIAVVRFSLEIPFTTHKWLYASVCVCHPPSLASWARHIRAMFEWGHSEPKINLKHDRIMIVLTTTDYKWN